MEAESDYGIEISKFKNFVLITFINYQRLDLYNARDLADVFKIQNENGSDEIAIDMSTINHIDSSGLGCIATQGMFLAKKNKRLNLISITNGVSHLFKTSGFEKMFKLYPDKNFLE